MRGRSVRRVAAPAGAVARPALGCARDGKRKCDRRRGHALALFVSRATRPRAARAATRRLQSANMVRVIRVHPWPPFVVSEGSSTVRRQQLALPSAAAMILTGSLKRILTAETRSSPRMHADDIASDGKRGG